ncbi:phosphotransferase family protein [Methylobacterium aquaticum]|jgi:hypothetical protein|uniref:phosphotransferase family protein n=1 Tax=Methylobacterium aquaticum TaxID=270351 RepID=UPI00069F5FC2|nr:phosphotransferase [Methylobacterium aquaticum]
MMIPDESGPTALSQRVEAVIAGRPDWLARRPAWTLAVTPLASPTHRGTASDGVRVTFETGDPVFLKLRHPDMAADIVPHAGAAARRAAALGVGPEVMFESEAALGLADLSPPWREARMGDLQDPDLLGRTLDAKKRLHAGGRLGPRVCPFARIRSLAAEAQAAGAPLPDETGRLLATVALIGEAVTAAGIDLTFCHNDGLASNVMIRGGDVSLGDVRLVDFDSAGDNDPWYDVGALLNETCLFEDQRRAAIERYAGRCDERLYNRCRLYGAVDDVMGGLWGIVRAVTSARTGIEFYKYGTWRLLHARTTLGARDCEAWMRGL